MSDYDTRPGGSLKLKGGVAEGGIVKKKKKKSKPKPDSAQISERERVEELLFQEEDSGNISGSRHNSPAPNAGASKKTEAERRFQEVQKRRLAARVAKLAHKTHKERVNEFNTHLESLSEHHDIPKVGPG